MRYISSILVLSLALGGAGLASTTAIAKPKGEKQAMKGVPPGLAKKFGATVPAHAYIAIDPRYDDRAWFLVGGRWVLHERFEPELRTEVLYLRTLPALPVPPPVPLPRVGASLRIVHFG